VGSAKGNSPQPEGFVPGTVSKLGMSSRISVKPCFSERKTRTSGFWSNRESRHPSRIRSVSGLAVTRFMIGEPHSPQKTRN